MFFGPSIESMFNYLKDKKYEWKISPYEDEDFEEENEEQDIDIISK